jgi:hypothetical protein
MITTRFTHYLLKFTRASIPISIADAMTTRISTIEILSKTSIMFTGIKITGVTGSAGTRVLWPAIADILVIVGVARDTADVTIMVARIITVVWMPVINWRPAIGRVTGITIRRGNKMIPPLAGCPVTIVTRYTVASDTLMIPGAANKSCRGMTIMAIQVSRDVICGFTCCRYTVARRAIVHDTRMIEHRAGKTPRGMTDTTILISGRMVTCFASGEYSIVAGLAVIHDTLMIKRSRKESSGYVTLTAIIVCGHMVCGFTCCIRTIVAGGAIINNASVIKAGACKGCSVVAYGTVFRCG